MCVVCVFSFLSGNTDGFFKKSSDYSRVVVRKQQHYGACRYTFYGSGVVSKRQHNRRKVYQYLGVVVY